MDAKLQEKAELLIRNRETIGKCFMFGDSSIALAGSAVLTMRGKEVTKEEIKAAKNLLNSRVGIFSNIRSYGEIVFVCMIASQPDPEEYLSRALTAYGCLKEQFFWSTYLPFAAFIMAQDFPPEKYEEIAVKAKSVYEEMKKKHPFLTSSNHSPLCVMAAMSDRDFAVIEADDEQCYQLLKDQFFDKDSVYLLSHVLALQEGNSVDKCERTMSLFRQLKESGLKYGTNYELSALGFLACGSKDSGTIIREMSELDGWLKKQKEFGIFSMISAPQRLMYAGMLIQNGGSDRLSEEAAVDNTIAMVIMEEIIMYSIICSTSIAVTSSSSQ